MAPTTVEIAIDASGLPAGIHQGEIAILSADGSTAPQTIPVVLAVQTIEPATGSQIYLPYLAR